MRWDGRFCMGMGRVRVGCEWGGKMLVVLLSAMWIP